MAGGGRGVIQQTRIPLCVIVCVSLFMDHRVGVIVCATQFVSQGMYVSDLAVDDSDCVLFVWHWLGVTHFLVTQFLCDTVRG